MASSPSKEATPASDAKASDATKTEKPAFTEKEERILKVAWLCLKGRFPDIDVEKLVKHGEFKTAKTASNTWGVIKKKLLAGLLKADGEDCAGDEGSAASVAPKTLKAKATPKKRASAKNTDGDAEDDAEGGSPVKKPRKTPVKKGKKTDADAGDVEEVEKDVKVKDGVD